MKKLIRYEFTCPFCGEDKVTFITEEKRSEIGGSKLIGEIFNPRVFSATYREIFISKICSKCQSTVFEPDDEKEFDVPVDINTTNLEGLISRMYEDDRD